MRPETVARSRYLRLGSYWARRTKVTALPLLLGAGAAMAEQATGTVDSVDPTTRTVVVNGQPCILVAGPHQVVQVGC